MASILDMVRVMQQMEEAARRAYRFADLHEQIARSAEQAFRMGDLQSRIASATEQFRTMDSVLQQARIQMQMRDDLVRDQTRAISALASPAFDASQSITKMLDRFRVDTQLADVVAKTSRDWSEILRASETFHQRTFLPVETHLARLYELSAISEASLLRVRAADFGSRFGLADLDRNELLDAHTRFGAEYRTFFDDVSKDDVRVIELPKPLTELPAAEFANQASLVVSTSRVEYDDATDEAERAVSDELATEAGDHLTVLVSDLSQDLTDLLRGARVAVESRPPDFVRHFATSFRELFTQVLQTVAPDDQVKAWTKDKQHYHNGRPTRRARLLYVIRDVDSMFGGFLNADVDTALTFLDAFQKGTHGVRPDFSEDEILRMGRRMEGLLRLMLVVHQIH